MRSRAKRIGATLSIDGSFGPGGSLGHGSIVSLRLDPMLESDQERAGQKRVFLWCFGLALLFLLDAWAKKGNDEVPFVSSSISVAALLAAAGYSGWRYLQLRHRELRRPA